MEAAVVAAVEGGVDMVQLRKKDLPGRALLEVGTAAEAGDRRPRALLIVNERVDVAQACDADGVQLGEDGLPVPVVRRLLGEGKLIGRSVHSVEAAMQAESEGADFLVVGTIFTTGSHPGAKPAGVELLAQVAGAGEGPIPRNRRCHCEKCAGGDESRSVGGGPYNRYS